LASDTVKELIIKEAKMTDQARKAERFRGLHIPGKPLVLFNIWDAGSAKALASAGAKAIATGAGRSPMQTASPTVSTLRSPWRSTTWAELLAYRNCR
jgi:hypothetical protein